MGNQPDMFFSDINGPKSREVLGMCRSADREMSQVSYESYRKIAGLVNIQKAIENGDLVRGFSH